MVCSLAFKPRFRSPLSKKNVESENQETYFANLLNVSVWKNSRYVLWIVAVPIALCGYFVPYVHMVSTSISNVYYLFRAVSVKRCNVEVFIGHLFILMRV